MKEKNSLFAMDINEHVRTSVALNSYSKSQISPKKIIGRKIQQRNTWVKPWLKKEKNVVQF